MHSCPKCVGKYLERAISRPFLKHEEARADGIKDLNALTVAWLAKSSQCALADKGTDVSIRILQADTVNQEVVIDFSFQQNI